MFFKRNPRRNTEEHRAFYKSRKQGGDCAAIDAHIPGFDSDCIANYAKEMDIDKREAVRHYQHATVVLRHRHHFSPAEVREACDFLMINQV